MKAGRIVLGVAWLSALALYADRPVLGQTFTFNVPVDVQNLHPDVDQIRVRVRLLDENGSLLSRSLESIAVGASRGVSTNLTIVMIAAEPLKVKRWDATVLFHNQTLNRWRRPMTGSNIPFWRRLESGSSLRSGSIS